MFASGLRDIRSGEEENELTVLAQGYVTLRPEDDEDMWHVYNLISEVRTSPSPIMFVTPSDFR